MSTEPILTTAEAARLVGAHPRTGHRINRSAALTLGATLREARARLAELKVEIDELIAADAPTARSARPTLIDCAERWCAGQRDRVRPGTAEHYAHVLGHHALSAPAGPQGVAFGELYADELTRADVDAWCRWAERHTQADGRLYAKATVEGWWRVLCQFLRYTAADLGRPDPINRVKPPRTAGRAKQREQRTLTATELSALVASVEESRYAEVYVLAYTGMRPGELFALEWGDIDEAEGCIHIRRAHRRGRVDATKTDDPRDVALTDTLRDVLRAHRERLMQVSEGGVALPSALVEHLAVNDHLSNADVRRLLGYGEMKARRALAAWQDAGLLTRFGASTRPRYRLGEGLVARAAVERMPERPLVFPSRSGGLREPGSLHKPLALAAERAGIDQRVGPLVLRRTFNTLLLRAGVDQTVLRSQMGHCSPEMTARYAGVSLDAKRAAVELIEEEDD